MERKEKGELNGISLDEDDKIELSDDSDNEESSRNQQAANGNWNKFWIQKNIKKHNIFFAFI